MVNIDISTTNPAYWTYLHQLSVHDVGHHLTGNHVTPQYPLWIKRGGLHPPKNCRRLPRCNTFYMFFRFSVSVLCQNGDSLLTTPPFFDLFLQLQAGNFQVQCLADVLSWDTVDDIMMAAVSTWGDEIAFKHSIVDIVWNRGLLNVINLPNLLGIMMPMINRKPFLANQYIMGWEKRFVFHGSKGDMAIRRDLRRDFNRKKWAN